MLADKLDAESCVHKFRILRQKTYNEQEEKCMNCTKQQELGCPDYKPISKTQQPFRQGINAFMIY